MLGNPPTGFSQPRSGRAMENRRNSFEYEDLLACGRGELFAEGAAVAAAADADVRPHLRDRRSGRRARQGPGARRARREAGPLVLPLPLQGRSGDAGLPRPRRAVADARLLPRLARRAGQGPRARPGRGQVLRPGAADREEGRLRRRHQAGDALQARARHRRRLAVGGRHGDLPRRATSRSGCSSDTRRCSRAAA